MRYATVAVADAVGAILVHTLRAGGRVLKKGRVLDGADVAALAAAGRREVACVRLEPGDLGEDEAAATIAAALVGDDGAVRAAPARTGRANLHATAGGLLRVDAAAVARVNAIDEAITLATLPADAPVEGGEMVATVKIIPFAAPAAAVAAAADAARGAIEVRRWRPRRAGLILTRLADTAERVLDRAAAAQRGRMARLGGVLAREVRVAHDEGEVAAAIGRLAAEGLDPILALGASAIMDRRDVIPAALARAGGEALRLGMPVDPGNLLLLGRLGDATVIGVPGCARSTKRSGFDWVLERVCAGVPVAPDDLAAMGVGGLLEEIAVRPAPRAGDEAAAAGSRRVAAVILAAGRATRMGGDKLLAELDGEPIIRRVARTALASAARPVVVVTGHRGDEVAAALAGLDVVVAPNPAFADGMSTSLRAGVAAAEAADPAVDGALIVLGDMPRVGAGHLDALIDAFDPDGGAPIVVPTCERKRGNPVLWARRYFAEMAALEGDVGARALLERHADEVALVALDDPAILLDVDTPEALAALRGEPA